MLKNDLHICGDFYINVSDARQIVADARLGVDDFYEISNAMNRAPLLEITKCAECVWGTPWKEFPRRNEPPYKHYRQDILFCECEELVGDEPVPVAPDFFCGYSRKGVCT